MVCKSCGSEVSPYITECPYCGNRLRKRAPKLDRDQRPAERRPSRQPSPLLTRLRRNEIPGIRGDSRPHATGALLAAGLAGCLLWRTGLWTDLGVMGRPGTQPWRLFTAAFTYDNIGYAFIVLGAIGLFGWLIERRHGAAAVLVLFVVGGVGGLAATAAIAPMPLQLGACGAALALICAWAIPDLRELRFGRDIEGDLLGALAIAVAVAAMPLAVTDASWLADAVGVVAGVVIGLPLALLGER